MELLRTGKVLAVVRSTDFAEPLAPTEVLLPSDPEGRLTTRLTQETVAVCEGKVELDATEIRETGGLVPAHLLREICRLAGLRSPHER